MDGIHILKGRGSNCTCYDCAVLYGGTCSTTPDNNLLDRIEKGILKVLDNKYVSKGRINKSIEAIRPHAVKYFKITNNTFDKHYYGWLPLIYAITSVLNGKPVHPNASEYDVRDTYMQGRLLVLWKLESDYKLEK